MVRWWESPHKILHKHTDTFVTQWRFKRTVSKSMDTHPQEKKKPQTYNHHWSTQLYNKLSALTSQMKSQKSQSIRFLQLSPLSPFHTQTPLPHACPCKPGDNHQNPHWGLLCRPTFIYFLFGLVPRLVQKQTQQISSGQSVSVIPSACSHACCPRLAQEGRKTDTALQTHEDSDVLKCYIHIYGNLLHITVNTERQRKTFSKVCKVLVGMDPTIHKARPAPIYIA